MANTSKSLGSYRDIEPFLKRAVRGPINLDFDAPKDALQFVARANKFRQLYREDQQARGYPYESPYDFLMIRHPNDPVTGKRGRRVLIEGRTMNVTVRDEQGNEVTVDPTFDADDKFLEEFETKARGPLGLRHSE